MLRYGGNTSCVEVTLSDGTEIILDAGTGIRGLGAARASRGDGVHVLLTHLHLDHIQGLLFFSPFFDAQAHVEVWGPPGATLDLRERLARYLSAPLSPIEIRELPSRVTFRSIPSGDWRIGNAHVTARLVLHRGTTLGYRITEGDVSLCYLPDHEPALGASLETQPSQWISGHELARGASLLIHDGQYTANEYAGRRGWGHSSIEDALAFAHRANPNHLILSHHDPLHDDEHLDALGDAARSRWESLGHPRANLELAAEGRIVQL